MAGYKLTLREGPKVKHVEVKTAREAITVIESAADDFAGRANSKPLDVMVKTFDPVQQVFARIELVGPRRLSGRLRAGVDIRGDGSTESYLGLIQKKLIEQRTGETAVTALERVLNDQDPEEWSSR